MKKLLLIIILAGSALISRAQTTTALADTAFAHKDYSHAFDYYADALKADNNNVRVLRRMGYCMMNLQGQELNATRYFAQALKIQPNDPVSNYYMGVIFMDAAKDPKHHDEKAQYKAKAQLYLNSAVNNGSEDAKSAIKDLNAI